MKRAFLSTKSLRAEEGFTVIETLIVFGIAGMILLTTFLAIPALQRSSRNNQRKQDVSAILQAVSHWELNHGGEFPGPTEDPTQTFLDGAHVTYYKAPSPVPVMSERNSGTAADITVSSSPDVDTVTIYNYARCDSATAGAAKSSNADYRDIVAIYAIETGSGAAQICQQL